MSQCDFLCITVLYFRFKRSSTIILLEHKCSHAFGNQLFASCSVFSRHEFAWPDAVQFVVSHWPSGIFCFVCYAVKSHTPPLPPPQKKALQISASLTRSNVFANISTFHPWWSVWEIQMSILLRNSFKWKSIFFTLSLKHQHQWLRP